MKNTGIVRKIDSLGRLVIPMEIRRLEGLDHDTPMEIFTVEEGILIRKHKECCEFCGQIAETEFKDKKICTSCLDNIKRL